MKIAVLGLGNVGLVAAVCLSDLGHIVYGIDISDSKINDLQAGNCYIHEPKLADLLKKNIATFTPTLSLKEVGPVDCFTVCVGTPAMADGEVSLEQVRSTFEEIAKHLHICSKPLVVLRSTVPPGTVESLVLPILQEAQTDFNFIYHPEFLREGNAVADFMSPELHVIGMENPKEDIPHPELFSNASNVIRVPFRSAEMLKYLNNSFHALKVVFANELASMASAMQVPIEPLFDCFLSDTKLNISASYLKPGFAFGGPCLTKELAALQHLAQKHQVSTPLINAINQSNEAHLLRLVKSIERHKPQRIVVFGLSFKQDTDDLRSSSTLELVNFLKRQPSYLPKREFWILDHALAMKNLKHKDSFHTFTDIPDVRPDLIVLGSHRLSSNQVDWIVQQECKIYDLCLTGLPAPLQKMKVSKPYEAE
jgi:GDP-mannose 6-dehydrogenase